MSATAVLGTVVGVLVLGLVAMVVRGSRGGPK
jgi:hypothetical protein